MNKSKHTRSGDAPTPNAALRKPARPSQLNRDITHSARLRKQQELNELVNASPRAAGRKNGQLDQRHKELTLLNAEQAEKEEEEEKKRRKLAAALAAGKRKAGA